MLGTRRSSHDVFNLRPLDQRLPSPVAAVVRPSLERLLGLPLLNAIYDSTVDTRPGNDPADFCEGILRTLHCRLELDPEQFDDIPKTGPLVFVANHPFGGVEGMVLGALMFRVRKDAKLIVNEMLGCIPEMQRMSFLVNVFGSADATRSNVRALRQAINHLKSGGCIGVFPAGAVSHLQLEDCRVADPSWSPHIAWLIRRSGAAVVPVYFPGRNGAVFQLAGLVHPRLRTALLPREITNKHHWTCRPLIGSTISADEMAGFSSDEQAIQYLRHRCYALAERLPGKPGRVRRLTTPIRKLMLLRKRSQEQALGDPVPADDLERELNLLPPDSLLACNGELCVYLAEWKHLDATAYELGRLREVSFRAVGEGTGKPIDLDDFDRSYRHLLVWNREKREIVGSYRLGLVDELTRRNGPAGMYLSTLFDFAPAFLDRLGPAIELGRSFVRPEYQRSFSPLMLLWKGIGQFIARNPRYRTLVGPVSISSRYALSSRAVMVTALSAPSFRSPLAPLVRPKTPFILKQQKIGPEIVGLGRLVRNIDELNAIIADMDPSIRSIPILLKQYLKLGAKTLAFNIDPAFAYCLDCLCVLDLLHADKRQVQRYMGREQAARFYDAHRATTMATA